MRPYGKNLQVLLFFTHRTVVLAHDGLFADISLLGRLFEVLALLCQKNNSAPLHLLLKARDELFVRLLGVFLEINHRKGLRGLGWRERGFYYISSFFPFFA